ncbi:MAG: sensor histidine kinase [Clostridiaceae bacterium]|nr:sensor histidine kinase [Clostridiaceae bacterium]
MWIKFVKNKFLYKYIFKVSIKTRLIVYFILSVLIPTIIIATTIYIKSTNIITAKIDSSIKKNLMTTENIIVQKFASVGDISTLIALNSKVIDVLERTNINNSAAIVDEMATLDQQLDSYYLSNMSYMTSTTIFPRIYVINRPEYNEFNFTDKVLSVSKIENEKWYKDHTDGAVLIIGNNKSQIGYKVVDTIKVVRRMYTIKNIQQMLAAVLTIDIEAKYFTDILKDFKASPGSSNLVIDESNTIVLSNDSTLIGKKMQDIAKLNFNNTEKYDSYIDKINGENMLISVKKIPSLKWRIVALSPIKELNDELIDFKKIVYIVIAVCMILSLITALLLAENVTGPVKKLVKSMSKVKSGDFEINLVYKRNDEFAYLISEYKRMVSEIKKLIEKLYTSDLEQKKAEIKVKDAELKALQAQINPHFLYNTLDSINWLALKYKAEDISTMVKSLSNFFRYSLNKGSNVISFEDEIKQVESYLKIQEIRFQDKLNYKIDISSEIYECYTVKLILQPIVENAIIHAIEKIKVGGRIVLLGSISNGIIEISISDNGLNPDIDKMNSLFSSDSNQTSSFGLRNVNLRIKQFFGEEYGLKFIRNSEGGTTVIIRICEVKNWED